MVGYGEEGFDYSTIKNIEKKYQSRVIFLDTNGAKSFVLEISPVYLTLSFKSDYIWVGIIYLLHLYNQKIDAFLILIVFLSFYLFLGLC